MAEPKIGTIGALKKAIEKLPDDMRVVLVGDNRSRGEFYVADETDSVGTRVELRKHPAPAQKEEDKK